MALNCLRVKSCDTSSALRSFCIHHSSRQHFASLAIHANRRVWFAQRALRNEKLDNEKSRAAQLPSPSVQPPSTFDTTFTASSITQPPSPTSSLHHRHQASITCIDPPSPTSTLHHRHRPSITSIEPPSPTSSFHHLHRASITGIELHHLHRAFITGIKLPSPASTLHRQHRPSMTIIDPP